MHYMAKKKARKAPHHGISNAAVNDASAFPVCRVAKLRKIAGSLQSGLDEVPTDKAEKSSHPELQCSEEIQEKFAARQNVCPKLAAKIAAWRAAKLSGTKGFHEAQL